MRPTKFSRRTIAAVAFAACALLLCGLAFAVPANSFELGFSGFLMLGMARQLSDEQCKGTRALPAAASSTVDGGALDLGHGSRGDLLVGVELKITAPAVNATMAPDTRTFTYSVIHSDNADLSSPTVLYSSVIVQTGAGGVGAASTTATVALPSDVKRYVGVRVVSGASTADASSVSATTELLF